VVLFPVYLFLFSNTYRSVITSLMVLFSNNVHQLMLLSATRVAQASCMFVDARFAFGLTNRGSRGITGMVESGLLKLMTL
jgi:hypothetical protein